jgi:nucleotide-binding universal stress UspA family protein
MSNKIIALIDGSTYGKSVCELAAWVAVRTGRSVEVLHVLGRRDVSSHPSDFSGNLTIDERDNLLSELVSLDEQKAKLAHKRGRLILDQATECLKQAGLAEFSTKLRNGDLLDTVREFEAGADLIVIGKRGEAADFAKLHLGSNLERVVRVAHKPVLVAARAFKPIERVMIAFDGGPSSMKAISHITAGSLFKGLPLHLLMAGSETREAKEQVAHASGLLETAGYAVEARILPGEADTVIAREVQDRQIDFLVMGAYGHSRLRNLIIGSTTTEMIRSCKVPILLFR